MFLAAALVSTACTGPASPPPRPEGIPAAAVWAGGVDGGSFITCSYDATAGLNICAVYNDFTGRLEVEGEFDISGPTRAPDVGQFAYSGSDGKKIYLKDGSVLTPHGSALPSTRP